MLGYVASGKNMGEGDCQLALTQMPGEYEVNLKILG